MIPLELQDELKKILEKEFENLRLKNILNERVPIKIYPQHLPNKSKGEESIDPYPCIIIRLANGNKEDENGANVTAVQFIIGIIDRDDNNQGYRDCLIVSNRIIENLQRNPFVLNKFELKLPLNWTYYNEDAEPYFFAGIETNWDTPTYIREDLEDMI